MEIIYGGLGPSSRRDPGGLGGGGSRHGMMGDEATIPINVDLSSHLSTILESVLKAWRGTEAGA